MTTCLGRFTASASRKLLSVYVFSDFPFGFEGRIWDLIVSVPDHCLSFYFSECYKVPPAKTDIFNNSYFVKTPSGWNKFRLVV